MALINTWCFTRTIILWDVLAEATHNKYRVVSVRKYTDKKERLPDGYTLTLMVLKDDYEYGVDKNGEPRETNLYQSFDVTVLNRNKEVQKGDIVELVDFDSQNSYAIGFDLLLRFNDMNVIKPGTGGKTDA